MPFFESNNNLNIKIDYEKYQPVSVIASFNRSGKIIPVYLGLTDLYGNACKVKIDGVACTKDGIGRTTYRCLYSTNKRQQQINLTFFIHQHLWVLEN